MAATHRPLRTEEDFARVRALLVDTYPVTPFHWNWEVRRWDGFRFHREETHGAVWARGVELWETGGDVVGAVIPETPGSPFLQLDPDHRHLEEEMILWSERHLPVATATGDGTVLWFAVHDYDIPRLHLMDRLGYTVGAGVEVSRRMRFGAASLPEAPAAPGYEITTTRPDDPALYGRMADLLNAAFGRSTHTANEYRNFVLGSPSFDHGLNIVAEAPDGSLAGHTGVTVEPVNRYAVVEPVCVHPAHQRRGLAMAMVRTGLRLARDRGAVEAHVDSGGGEGPNLLYDGAGFTEKYPARVFEKRFD